MQQKYMKAVSEKMVNNGLQLKVGLNIDPVPFNTSEECCAGGIYYCDITNIAYWSVLLRYSHVCDVSVPDDAKVCKYEKKKVRLTN